MSSDANTYSSCTVAEEIGHRSVCVLVTGWFSLLVCVMKREVVGRMPSEQGLEVLVLT